MVAVITDLGVPVKEVLSYIGMNATRAAINLEYDGEKEWINSLEEVWVTHSLDQCMECLTRPALKDEVLNIYWLNELFTGNKKDNGKPEPRIKP